MQRTIRSSGTPVTDSRPSRTNDVAVVDHTTAQQALEVLSAMGGYVASTDEAKAANALEGRPLRACESCCVVFTCANDGPLPRRCPTCREDHSNGVVSRAYGVSTRFAPCLGCVLAGPPHDFMSGAAANNPPAGYGAVLLRIGGRQRFCSNAHTKHFARFRSAGGTFAYEPNARRLNAVSPDGEIRDAVTCGPEAVAWLRARFPDAIRSSGSVAA